MSHLTVADYLAHRIEGMPLPCACPACAARIRRWEEGRAADATLPETLPPGFWARQAARLGERAARPTPLRRRALAGAAALLVLGAALGGVLIRDRAPAPDDFETRYAAVEDALRRSSIGDLEACGVLLNETATPTTEEVL
jgi:anti-sigma factor RsiW